MDGKPAALVQISRVGDQSIQDVSETVRRYLSESASMYPEGVELTLWQDQSVLPLMLSNNSQAAAMITMTVSLAYGVLFSTLAALFVVPAFWLVMDDLRGGALRVTGAIGELLGAAPRLTQWMARYPYIQESMQDREFTDLQIDDDLGLDPEMAEAARRGPVRVYYEREFDQREMRVQLDVIAAKAPEVDDLVREVRVWAEQRTFQVGVHMLNGTIAPVDAAHPVSDILNASLGILLTATKAEFAAKNGTLPGSRSALLALGAFGRREFSTGAPLQLMFLLMTTMRSWPRRVRWMRGTGMHSCCSA